MVTAIPRCRSTKISNELTAHSYSEALSEPTSELSPEARNLASLLCSKIYFYLGAINDAVNAALNAGDAFTRDSSSGTREYKETIICK